MLLTIIITSSTKLLQFRFVRDRKISIHRNITSRFIVSAIATLSCRATTSGCPAREPLSFCIQNCSKPESACALAHVHQPPRICIKSIDFCFQLSFVPNSRRAFVRQLEFPRNHFQSQFEIEWGIAFALAVPALLVIVIFSGLAFSKEFREIKLKNLIFRNKC